MQKIKQYIFGRDYNEEKNIGAFTGRYDDSGDALRMRGQRIGRFRLSGGGSQALRRSSQARRRSRLEMKEAIRLQPMRRLMC